MFPRKNRVARLVEQLRASDEAAQQAAIEALESLSDSRITAQEARTALEAAREQFPHPEAQELLLQIAYESPDPDFIPIIERDFLHYSPDARSWALRTLAAIGTEDAVRLLAMLLTRHAEDIEELSLLELEKQPQHATTLFPTLLAVLAREGASQHHFEIARLCLEYLRQGALASEDIRDAAPNLIACYDSLTDELARYQSPDKIHAIWDDEDYLWARSLACLLLDLMGYVDTPEVRQRLNNALEYIDARPLLFATTSLVQLGAPVPPGKLHAVAANAETRRWLFDHLQSLNRLELYPQAFASQAALAESEMVDWLMFPTELGCPPDEIELVAVYDIETEEGLAEAYIFRFRMEDEPWEVGLAGPYLKAEQPAAFGMGATFSRFEKWAEYTLDEHVARILELTGESDWRVVGKRILVEED